MKKIFKYGLFILSLLSLVVVLYKPVCYLVASNSTNNVEPDNSKGTNWFELGL